MLATGAFLLVSSLGHDALLGWAWRIPFLASAILFLLALFIRRHLEETPEYVEALARVESQNQRQAVPALQLFRRHGKALVIGFFSVTGHNALNYAMAVIALSLMTSDAVGLERSAALGAVTIGTVFGIIGTPIGGLAADRFGPAKVFATGSALGAVYALPLFSALSSGSSLMAGAAIAGGYGLVIAMTSGSQGAFLAHLFPARERYSGIAITREINGAVMAGLTPLGLALVIELFDGAVVAAAVVVSVCCVLSLLAILASRTLRDQSIQGTDAAGQTTARGEAQRSCNAGCLQSTSCGRCCSWTGSLGIVVPHGCPKQRTWAIFAPSPGAGLPGRTLTTWTVPPWLRSPPPELARLFTTSNWCPRY